VNPIENLVSIKPNFGAGVLDEKGLTSCKCLGAFQK
jgi:hypothetical protein